MTGIAKTEWVLLAYRLPREPSTPRISVWRKLRRLGAVQVLGGLVALPRDARTLEQLGWIADEVIAAGGDPYLFEGRPGSLTQENELVERMRSEVATAYRKLVTEAETMPSDTDPEEARRGLARLRRELARIRRRDFFPPPERERAIAALADVAAAITETTRASS
ncbi:MAG: Chromate resistance protein ChrB [Acidimicrobiia bacterium]